MIAHSVLLVFFLPTWDKTPPPPPIVVYKCKPKSLVIAQTNHTQQGPGYPCQAFFLTTSFMLCVWGRADGNLAYPECVLFAEMIRIVCRDWIRKPRSLSLFLCMQLLIVSGMLSGSGRHTVLRIRGSSGVSGNIRRSPQLRRSQLGVTGRKRHQVRINHRRVKRVQKEGLENDVLLRSIIMTSKWDES